MKVLMVTGSRGWNNRERIRTVLSGFNPGEWIVIHGAARGADRIAGEEAKRLGFLVEEMPADWEQFGRAAGIKRNLAMAEVADACVGFWDGKSRGTKHALDATRNKGVPTTVYRDATLS